VSVGAVAERAGIAPQLVRDAEADAPAVGLGVVRLIGRVLADALATT